MDGYLVLLIPIGFGSLNHSDSAISGIWEKIRIKVLLFLVISKPLKEPTVFMEEPIKNQVVIKGYKEPKLF
jgi:hypothetical protein